MASEIKFWVLSEHRYGDYEEVGRFSSKQKAENFLDNLEKEHYLQAEESWLRESKSSKSSYDLRMARLRARYEEIVQLHEQGSTQAQRLKWELEEPPPGVTWDEYKVRPEIRFNRKLYRIEEYKLLLDPEDIQEAYHHIDALGPALSY